MLLTSRSAGEKVEFRQSESSDITPCVSTGYSQNDTLPSLGIHVGHAAQEVLAFSHDALNVNGPPVASVAADVSDEVAGATSSRASMRSEPPQPSRSV